MKLLFDLGYAALQLWLKLQKKQLEERGFVVTELSVTVSAFPVEQKTTILVNGVPLND